MFERVATALVFRRLGADLARVATALEAQTALLARLTDRLAPVDPHTSRSDVREDTGVSHVDPTEVLLAEEYSQRTYRDTGHIPDDEELAIYLADEHTVDLRERLVARDLELERLRASREW